MEAVLRCLVLLSGLGLAGSASALSPGNRVDNFRLLDQKGESHELYYLSDAKAVVLMVHGNGCPIVRQALPVLKEVRDRYRAQGVEFLLINSNLQDDRDAIAREAAEFDIDFPILVDETQLIGESLGLTRTAEVFVIDPRKWKLVYRGPLDDRLAYGAQKPAPTKRYLTDALDAVLAAKAGRRPRSGCGRLPDRSPGARPARRARPDLLLGAHRSAARRAMREPATGREASGRGP